jgi:hypothetical protein
MKRGRLVTVLALTLFVVLWTVGPTEGPSVVMLQDIRLRIHAVPAASFSVESIWDNIYNDVNPSNLQTIVRDISEDTPLRIWYPLDKEPSVPLAEAWEYVNNTLNSYTSGGMCFRFRTQQQNLVAIKYGIDSTLAPIVIVGTVSSGSSPGANAYAASTAAVLEIARILYSRSLTNDVYFVLVNTITSGYDSEEYGNQGVSELLDALETEYRKPAALFWLSLLLYESGDSYGDHVAMRGSYSSSYYKQNEFIADLAEIASTLSGGDRVVQQGSTANLYIRSGAYEANERGIPAFVLSQYYLDGLAGSEFDKWDTGIYSYDLLEEAVGLVASLTTYLGILGKGQVPRFSKMVMVSAFDSETIWMPLTGESPLQVDIEWTGGDSLTAELVSPGGVTLISATQSDGNITMNYGVTIAGLYGLVLINQEMVSSFVSYGYEYWQDYDCDTLNDEEEYTHGTDSLNADTDMDLLNDDAELFRGTDPLSPDTDSDGLGDFFEVLNGLNPLSNDTDMDGLSDSYEIAHSLMPNNADTDGDGIPDGSDWAPREHWVNAVIPAGLGVVFLIVMIWMLNKKRIYGRTASP